MPMWHDIISTQFIEYIWGGSDETFLIQNGFHAMEHEDSFQWWVQDAFFFNTKNNKPTKMNAK